MKNSWYLKKDNLHHFICKCGQHDTMEEKTNSNSSDYYFFETRDFKREEIDLTKLSSYHPDNSCSACHNEIYLDVEALLYSDKTKYWSSSLLWSYKEVYIDEEEWRIVSYIKIPKLLQLFKNKVITYDVELSNCNLRIDGRSSYREKHTCLFKKMIFVEDKFKRIESLMREEMSSRLLNLVLTHPSKNLKWLNNEKIKLKELIFCLENPNIRSVDMVKWIGVAYFLKVMNRCQYLDKFFEYILNNRKEKSVKKSLFISYKEMMHHKAYNPMADYIFCRTIQDVNHLAKIIRLNAGIKIKLFEQCSIENIFFFFEFLNHFYQERHIVHIFNIISHDDLYHNLLSDSISLFHNKNYREEFHKNFQKTTLSIRAIHDELTRHSRRLQKINIQEQIFSYSDYLLKIEGNYEGIEYKLPTNSLILYEWGEVLHNCLFSYKHSILRGSSIIVGLFVNRFLTYALEIRNHKIVQISASYNRRLEEVEREKVDRWFKNIYMKNLIQALDR